MEIAGSIYSWTRAGTLLVVALALMSCAHQQPGMRPRLGTVMCKEGPPSWSASDGRRLMYRSWEPAHQKPRALVVAVPGWNGTAGDIEPLARYLSAHDFAVYSTGVRGQHGDLTAVSEHSKGNVDDGHLWERDFHEFAEWVQKRHPHTPVFLYGQSMGALTAINASDMIPDTRGIILHAPAVAMMDASPVVRIGVAQMRALWPHRLLFNVGLISCDKPTLTNNVKFDDAWCRSADRVRPGFTWAFLDEAMKLGSRARNAAAHLEMPVLMLTGDKDPIGTAGVGQRGFARLFRNIPSREKERRCFPDGYHDLIHDSNKEQALHCVGDWLDKQI